MKLQWRMGYIYEGLHLGLMELVVIVHFAKK
jgi:hypothetical protein